MAERADRFFGEEVRRLLTERKISLRALAARAGVDPGFLVRVLQGKRPPSQKLLSGASTAFDLPPDHFVETRRDKLVDLMSRNPAVVDVFYDQINAVSAGTPMGAWSPGTPEPPLNPLMILASADRLDPRVVQFAAAMLVRYRADEGFRRAVDATLPQMEELAQELSSTP